MDTLAFLHALYSDHAPGHVAIFTTPGNHTYWSHADNLATVSQTAQSLARECNVYVGISLQDQAAAFARSREEHPDRQGTPTTRGYSSTAYALPGLFADIDIQGPAHRATNLPPTLEEALSLAQAFPLPPSLIVFSGHGLQLYWLFREIWILESVEERGEAETLLKRFIATLQAQAARHGWQLDPTSDLARVFRIPGTFNRKPGLPVVPVRVIEEHLDCRYNPSDFDEYLIAAPPADAPPRREWAGPSGAVAPVLKHCQFIQHCQHDATTLSESAWYAMVSNLARLNGGREAVHVLSAPYPRYSQHETDQKIDHAVSAAGPHTCAFIQQQLGFTGCPPGGCGVKAPVALGVSRRALALAEARTRHAAAVERTQQKREAAIALARQIRAKRVAQTEAADGH